MVEVSNRADLIERKIDRELADDIVISREAGGVSIRKLGEVMEAAKLMALSGSMVPAFLRENPGGCFAVIWKAYAWGLDPFSVASMSYEVRNKRSGETSVSFMSQLVHAIIEARAPIKRRLEVRYEGEGDDRVCIVSATFRGEDQPREYRSPRLGDRKPKPRSQRSDDEDSTPGSPLWRTKPDLQQFYDASRDFARMYFPDVLLGIYTREEMAEVGFIPAAPATPTPPPSDDGGLATRLTASALARAGFPSDAAIAAIDEGMAKRDIGARVSSNPLSVDPEGAAPTLTDGAAPSPAPAEAATPPAPESDPPATPPPETEEGQPRAARARRSGRPPEDEARLV